MGAIVKYENLQKLTLTAAKGKRLSRQKLMQPKYEVLNSLKVEDAKCLKHPRKNES